MKENIHAFCREFDYPLEAEACFLDACTRIADVPEAASLLQENIHLLWAHFFQETGSDMVRLDKIAALTGIHPYTVYQVFFMLCAPHTQELYEQQGIDLAIYHDSMLDIKWKMRKTHQIFGVWGTKWGYWFRQFFLLQRFCLGRLEFELIPSPVAYENNGHIIRKGDPVLNMHIPASGPLDRQRVLDSYHRAAEFYREDFPGGTIPFQCMSWLLYPEICPLFPVGNLQAFQADFEIITAGIVPHEDDRWRVFQVPETVPVEMYPEKTSLQRNLKAWLLEGNQMGQGIGMFFYKDGVILPHTKKPICYDSTAIFGECFSAQE